MTPAVWRVGSDVPLLRVVVTGGPGTGKTTLLRALNEQGHAVGDDAARSIIRERAARGLSPRPDPPAFAAAVLARETAAYRAASSPTGVMFFDRSVVDALCLLDEALDSNNLDAQLAHHPYHSDVFLLPPWQAIYANDAERDHSFTHVVHVHERLMQWYTRCGYRLVEVPRMSLAQRCAFVLEHLGAVHESRAGTGSLPEGEA